MEAPRPAPVTVIPGQLEVPETLPLEGDALPRVAIVILNWNGAHHLPGCFESLLALDYPSGLRDVYLIDNGSTDGSIELIRREFSWVLLHENAANLGFSRGCNQGSELAQDAEILVFLNNDIRVEPGFLRSLLAPIVAKECEATSAKMLSWDGQCMNSAGGGMNFHGIGIQRGYGKALHPKYDRARWTLFACGGAMAMDAQVFRAVGGFDEEFFAYYEDVDLGWRTWIQGYSVRYVPGAICFHHHSSTSGRVPVERLRVLQVRNPLLACFKNYDDENLARVLPGMLALATRRCYIAAGLGDAPAYRIERMDTLPAHRGPQAWWQAIKRRLGLGAAPISKIAAADLIAINDWIGRFDHWSERRAEVQGKRRRPDEQILGMFLDPLWCIEEERGYRELHEGLTSLMRVDQLFSKDASPKAAKGL